jgi:RNA polymerase sigma-70 factor, ECF subfamily
VTHQFVSDNPIAIPVASQAQGRRAVDMPESFETYRSYLFAIAYRMLGTVMDAEDMVQETYLRYQANPPENLISLKAYLTTILTRLCVGQLELAYRQRELYLGPWLPEPMITEDTLRPTSTEERIDMVESLSVAFLVLMEQLQPIERAVFLLREVFEYDYPEIAEFLGKSEPACRQSFSRAKKHLAEHRPRFPSSPEVHQQLLTGFLEVVRAGDMNALVTLLAEDVTLWADSAGKVKGAAIHPIFGRDAVARFVMAVNTRNLPANYRVEPGVINHQPALIARADGQALIVITIEVEDGRIQTIRFMANPDKLTRI